ncbi:MAG: Maf family nucleotide pyrophosphatase [Bacteroidales bacterium]|jgi:septum formation protein|nr:Maf family nucleotide pyrophosphatase [Bacteroidales bacterium]MCI2122347.1 Maf family nucleotide pyrophosphatase [Bacteroidales bacterium]MCI2146183.1 Maf family nucleotide pyrophosphatase [Bacteroidales bacterium]
MDTLKKLMGRKLVLASQSPRRKELIAMLGIPFVVEPAKDSVENYPPGLPHFAIPEYLAEHKSETFHRTLEPGEILVTADTLVFCEAAILGKPKDRNDALRMLRILSGRMHQVTTGVVLRSLADKPGYPDKKSSFSVTTNVTFRILEDNEISYYIDTCKPFDKAGSYAIQEWIGATAITSIEGSYNNVIGLPTEQLYEALAAFC